MKHLKWILFTFLISIALTSLSESAYKGYYRFPDIHGEKIVFMVEGDLWQVSSTGGLAQRLTSHPGVEYRPRFSPDGKWLAFTGLYEGNMDVYVMPASGGEPKRLTYHPYSDHCLGWKPDGKSIVFRSRRDCVQYTYRIYEVDLEGGPPRKFAENEMAMISFCDSDHKAAFNRLSREGRHWKRYAGGTNMNVWYGDFKTLEFRKLTSFRGHDAFPMYHDGRIYFITDRAGRANIFSMTLEGDNVKQRTFHGTYDIRYPEIGEGQIVYQLGADLWVYSIAQDTTKKVEIQLPSERNMSRPYYSSVPDHTHFYRLSPEGKRLLVEVRGDLYIVPVKEGRSIRLINDSASREKYPEWAPDGNYVVCFSDATGEEELHLFHCDGLSKGKRLTKGLKMWHYPPKWSPDGKHIAYSDGNLSIFIADAKSGKVTRIDHSTVWETRSSDYTWSPDGRWFAYAKYEHTWFRSIFLYNLDTEKITRVTSAYTDDYKPVFDPDGKYLYFLSDRALNPLIGQIDFETILDKITRPYMVILQEHGKSPLVIKEPREQEEETFWEREKKKAEEKEKGVELAKTIIDLQGIEKRIAEIPVPAGHYTGLGAAKNKIFYMSRDSRGLLGNPWPQQSNMPVWKLQKYDFDAKEESTVVSSLNGYHINLAGDKMVVNVLNDYLVMNVDSGGLYFDDQEDYQKFSRSDIEKVNLGDIVLRVEPLKEWRQIFNEAWRLHRDFYWAPNMAGIDWAGVKEQYEVLLPRIATREALNDLIGQMIAELATSHTYIWGGEYRWPNDIPVGLLGADLEPDAEAGLYKFKKIYPSDEWNPDAKSPLLQPHIDVEEGDYLLAVNGEGVDTKQNVYSLFENYTGKEVLLTIGEMPDKKRRKSKLETRNVKIAPISSEFDLRYWDWVNSRRKIVDEKSNGRIGYLHIPNMSGRGLTEFSKHFYPQLEKEGLIVDIRYNTGGFISQLIIARLEREIWAYMKSRHGKQSTYPEKAFTGHIAVLVDEHAGSDGDIFPKSFQLLDLGPVIGMPTWGGVVGIRGDKPFVDGGNTTQPEFAWWSPDEGWSLENNGVTPDIVIDNLPGEVIKGIDAQLNKGIEVLMDMIEQKPVKQPTLPPWPDKSIESWKQQHAE